MPDEDTIEQSQEQVEQRRLSRLLNALPVFSGYITPDGHISRTHPETDASFLWSIPAFSYAHDSVTQIVDLCETAAQGERVQIERPYWKQSSEVESNSYGLGLLTLTPIFDDDANVDEIAVSLLDCDDAGVAQTNEFATSHLSAAHHRIRIVLDLAQTIIEASQGADAITHDKMNRRLDAVINIVDLISDPDRSEVPLKQLVQQSLGNLPERDNHTPLIKRLNKATIPISKVPLIALLLSELFDNASLHGAWRRGPGDPTGTITIKADVLDSAYGKNLHLQWIEEEGPSVPGLLNRGFGFTLAERLFPQLTGGEAQMLNAKNGLCWTFKLPISDAVNDASQAKTS
ncbi:MAG: hypothetical protein AAFP97_05170 [Pseudomonadota bacterium]